MRIGHGMGRLMRPAVAMGLATALAVGVLVAAGDVFAQRAERGSPRALESGAGDGGLGLVYRYITVGWIDWAALHLAEVTKVRQQVEPLVLLGLVQQSLGEPEEALAAYLKSARAGGDDRTKGVALTLAGNVLLEAGRWDEAEERYLEAVELLPQNAQAMYGLGRIAERKGRPQDALQWYEKASGVSAEWVEPVVRASHLRNTRGEFAAAVRLLKRVESLGTWHAEFHYQLARGYEGLMRAAAAGALDPSEIQDLMGSDSDLQGAPARFRELAVHAADRAFQIEPGHQGAEDLLSRLLSNF